MNHLDKYLLCKKAGIGDWMPDSTLDVSASSGIGTDIGNFFKGVGNTFLDPITGLFSGDPKKMIGSAGLTALTFIPGGRAVSGVGKAGLTTTKGLTTVGKNSAIHNLKQGVGLKDALANSYKFWKPGWAKGMAHAYTRPMNLAILGGAGGLNSYVGRNTPAGGQEGMGGFNPSPLAPIAIALMSLLRGKGGAAAVKQPTYSRSGLQTERMGSSAY